MIGDRHDIASTSSGDHLWALAQASVDINVRCGAGCGGIRNSQSGICPLPLPDKQPAESSKEQGIFPIWLPPVLLLPKRRIRRPTPGTRCIDRSNSSSKGSCGLFLGKPKTSAREARRGGDSTGRPNGKRHRVGRPCAREKAVASETSTCSAWARYVDGRTGKGTRRTRCRCNWKREADRPFRDMPWRAGCRLAALQAATFLASPSIQSRHLSILRRLKQERLHKTWWPASLVSSLLLLSILTFYQGFKSSASRR